MTYKILRSKSTFLWYTVEAYRETYEIVKVYHDKKSAEAERDRLQLILDRSRNGNKTI